MEYFFLLGRNPVLSYAEIISYLKSHGIAYEIVSFEKNYLIIKVADVIKFNIQDFGGVLKIAKANQIKTDKDLKSYIENYFAPERKFNYTVIGNGDEEIVAEIEEMLKQKFKEEKLKAQVRHSHSKIKMQEGEDFEFTYADVEFFYYNNQKTVYFGLIEQNYSYKEIKERDMHKPVRREALAISPRLAKILINLSQVREGELLADPFCGIGVIVQEAILRGINCIGGDKDRYAITGAKQNIEWLKSKYDVKGRARLNIGDSIRFPSARINGVATEPALGELVRKKMRERDAPEYIAEFEKLIIPILKRMKELKTPNAKIVLTMPFIRKYCVSVHRLVTATGLRVYELDERVPMPIKESREKQYIGRDIIILE
jgi:tRNA G10  N-methylase Trm11